MTYSITEVANHFHISPYTIRYYEKEGLLPFVSRNKSGVRAFTESDIRIFATVCCLKDTGMTIKEIRTYIELVMQGPSTAEARKKQLQAHREEVVEQINRLKNNLAQLDVKIETYQSPDAEQIITEQIKWISQEKNAAGLRSAFDDASSNASR
ncbi:MerR family transcriptional regulator [Listeria costaricensis]|uniref:MerR family transcriptional regulator n=1 Tax=Listeria costaricensis TaxID=2026604 RepID=UPI000C06E3D4|nr:MerR family transcriptional regulator [Listeria costaricensis]